MLRGRNVLYLAIGIIAISLIMASCAGFQNVEAKKSKQYKVRIFVSNAHLLGRDVIVDVLVQKSNQHVITEATVNAEAIIAKANSDYVRIKTLTVKDKSGQHPGQVFVCASAEGANISPFCESPSHLNSNQYNVEFDYNTIVQDLSPGHGKGEIGRASCRERV